MKQGFVIAAEGFQVRFERRETGVMIEVQFAPDKLYEVPGALWSDGAVLLRDRLSAAQLKQLADWLLDR